MSISAITSLESAPNWLKKATKGECPSGVSHLGLFAFIILIGIWGKGGVLKTSTRNLKKMHQRIRLLNVKIITCFFRYLACGRWRHRLRRKDKPEPKKVLPQSQEGHKGKVRFFLFFSQKKTFVFLVSLR